MNFCKPHMIANNSRLMDQVLVVGNGCQDAKVVGAALQKNFSAIIPNEKVSSEIVADNVLATLKADKQLSCSAI